MGPSCPNHRRASPAAEDEIGGELPSEVILVGSRAYNAGPTFAVDGEFAAELDPAKADAWAKKHAPKFVLIPQRRDWGPGRL